MSTAAAAQQSGYRACRRCRPDAAPGSPAWNLQSDLASRAMRLIRDGIVDRAGVAGLSAELGYSVRQLGRVLTSELGAGPLALARAHRADTARLLIQTTDMTMSDIAFAAGFASVRQFNDTVREVFSISPTQLRTEATRKPGEIRTASGQVQLRMPFRKPLDASWLRWFLSGHAAPGIEEWTGNRYRRTLRLPHAHAVISIEPTEDYVLAQLSLSDMRDLAPAVARIRHLLDLDSDPVAVDSALAADPMLAGPVIASAGIRVPGSVDGAELLLRTILGQQISLAAARTATGRLVAGLGEKIADPAGNLTHLFPTAEVIAERGYEVLTGPDRRVQSVVAAARAIASGSLHLHQGRLAADLRSDLLALRGVGPWTADYVRMRLLGDPDVLLDTDLVVRQGATVLGLDLTAGENWAPWRSYVSMHLWRVALESRDALTQSREALTVKGKR